MEEGSRMARRSKAAAFIEGVEVLWGEVIGSKLQAGKYGLNRSVVKFITVWINKHVDTSITNCHFFLLYPLSELAQE